MAVATSQALTLKAKLYRGLADPSRLTLLEMLRGGEKTVGDLAATAGLSQPNTSAHLGCLRDCGLVTTRQEGRFVFYAIADPETITMLTAGERILARIAEGIFNCTRYEDRPSTN